MLKSSIQSLPNLLTGSLKKEKADTVKKAEKAIKNIAIQKLKNPDLTAQQKTYYQKVISEKICVNPKKIKQPDIAQKNKISKEFLSFLKEKYPGKNVKYYNKLYNSVFDCLEIAKNEKFAKKQLSQSIAIKHENDAGMSF